MALVCGALLLAERMLEAAPDRASRRRRDRDRRRRSGRRRLSRCAQGRRRANGRGGRQRQRGASQLSGAAGSQSAVRQSARSRLPTGSAGCSSGFVAIALGICRAVAALERAQRRSATASAERPPRRSTMGVHARPAVRVRPLAGIQRHVVPAAVRLRPAVSRSANSGAHGHDHRLFARRAGRLWRGAPCRRGADGSSRCLRACCSRSTRRSRSICGGFPPNRRKATPT